MTDVPCVSTQFRHTPAEPFAHAFALPIGTGWAGVCPVCVPAPGVFYRDVDCDLMLVNVTCTM